MEMFRFAPQVDRQGSFWPRHEPHLDKGGGCSASERLLSCFLQEYRLVDRRGCVECNGAVGFFAHHDLHYTKAGDPLRVFSPRLQAICFY